MVVFSFYLFDRNCECIFYNDWKRVVPSTLPHEEEAKLIYGMLTTFKGFASLLRVSAVKDTLSYSTNNYKLHLLETATNYKFALLTDTKVGDLRKTLLSIYERVFVQHVIKNPLYKMGTKIEHESFAYELDKFVKGLEFF